MCLQSNIHHVYNEQADADVFIPDVSKGLENRISPYRKQKENLKTQIKKKLFVNIVCDIKHKNLNLTTSTLITKPKKNDIYAFDHLNRTNN